MFLFGPRKILEHHRFPGVFSVIKNCDALRALVPFVQFKKLEKHSWTSVSFSKVAGFSLQLY